MCRMGYLCWAMAEPTRHCRAVWCQKELNCVGVDFDLILMVQKQKKRLKAASLFLIKPWR